MMGDGESSPSARRLRARAVRRGWRRSDRDHAAHLHQSIRGDCDRRGVVTAVGCVSEQPVMPTPISTGEQYPVPTAPMTSLATQTRCFFTEHEVRTMGPIPRG